MRPVGSPFKARRPLVSYQAGNWTSASQRACPAAAFRLRLAFLSGQPGVIADFRFKLTVIPRLSFCYWPVAAIQDRLPGLYYGCPQGQLPWRRWCKLDRVRVG